MSPTRRDVLLASGGLVATSFLACARPRPIEPGTSWLTRIPQVRRDALAAAVERLLPGAVAAGAMVFIAGALSKKPFTFAQHEFDIGGLLLERTAQKTYGRPFAACPPHEQDAILRQFARGDVAGKRFDGRAFFQRLFTLTLEGFFGDPIHGGNRGRVGWRLAGYEPCWWAVRRIDPKGALPY